MMLIMLQLKNLPDAKVLEKFTARYPDADAAAVLPFLKLLRVSADLSMALDNFLEGYGLLQGRWWVLILLMREDNLTSTPSELAEKAGVSRATMTGLIDGLQREGLVQRLEDGKDRRKYTIKLTSAGQAKLDAVMPDYYRRVSQLMQPMRAEQRNTLVECLNLLEQQSGEFK
jgi:DNA-binding MarR family transcriptional regulator